MISDKGLLFIEPTQPASPTPVIDGITKRMCAAFRQAERSAYAYGGFHTCICGAHSSSSDYHLPNGDLTNSLCVHYVAHHRLEVPQPQLARIEAFTFGEAEPTWNELTSPRPILGDAPMEVRQALKELDDQIEALQEQMKTASAERDFETRAHVHDQACKLNQKKKTIMRDALSRNMLEHFGTIADPAIKLRWAALLLYQDAASPEIVQYLRCALESKEQSQTLSERLGPELADFMKRLQACKTDEI